MSDKTGIKYPGATTSISKVHINNMYIKYTFHFAILLICQILGEVPLPVISPFAGEALSHRLRPRLGLLHLSINLFSVLLEVPLLLFTLFLETSVRSNPRVFDTGSVAKISDSKQELQNEQRLVKGEVTMCVGSDSKVDKITIAHSFYHQD